MLSYEQQQLSQGLIKFQENHQVPIFPEYFPSILNRKAFVLFILLLLEELF